MSEDKERKTKKRKKKDKPMFSWEKAVQDNMNNMRDQSLSNMMEASERSKALAQLRVNGEIAQIQARAAQTAELFNNMTMMKDVNAPARRAATAKQQTVETQQIVKTATKTTGKTSGTTANALASKLATGKRGNIVVDETVISTKPTDGFAVSQSFGKQKDRLRNTNEVTSQYRKQGNTVPDDMKNMLWAQLMQMYADCAKLSSGPGQTNADPMCPQIMMMMQNGDIDGLMSAFFGGSDSGEDDGPLNAPKGRTVDTSSSGITELNKYGITPAGSYGGIVYPDNSTDVDEPIYGDTEEDYDPNEDWYT